MSYDYYESVKNDVLQWIDDYGGLTAYAANADIDLEQSRNDIIEDFCEHLDDDLWAEDSVTGNGSGSYTFNTSLAAQYVGENYDLFFDVLEEFGYFSTDSIDSLKNILRSPETADVIIRCCVLSSAINDAMNELMPEFDS